MRLNYRDANVKRQTLLREIICDAGKATETSELLESVALHYVDVSASVNVFIPVFFI